MNTVNNVVKTKAQILGAKVLDPAKEPLGYISDVILDKTSGRITYAILDCEAYLGKHGKLFALPWHTIHYDPTDESFVIYIDKEKLKNSVGLDINNLPDKTEEEWEEYVFHYYPSHSYWDQLI